MLMQKELYELVNKLTKEEITELLNYLKRRLQILTNNNDDDLVCPKCGSDKFKKFGFKCNNQRYRCKCGKTFVATINTLFYCSKLTKESINKFINYEWSGLTLNEISFYPKLNVNTCFRLRHKLYALCEKYVEGIKLEGKVEIDAAYTNINLKGTKVKNMPRKSSKRGGITHFQGGINQSTVCIIVGADDKHNYFMKIAGLGSESFEKYKLFTDKFKETKLLISDSKTSIKMFANHIGAESEMIKASNTRDIYTTDNGNNIQKVNEFCKCISDIKHKYHGVSIRHLNGYIAFQTVKKLFLCKYKCKRDEIHERVLDIHEKVPTDNEVCKIPLPINLKDAYWSLNYGIFKH